MLSTTYPYYCTRPPTPPPVGGLMLCQVLPALAVPRTLGIKLQNGYDPPGGHGVDNTKLKMKYKRCAKRVRRLSTYLDTATNGRYPDKKLKKCQKRLQHFNQVNHIMDT